jgi:hemoglobin
MDPLASLCDVVGEARLRALVAAFYRRVRTDDLIGPMYPPDDWAGAEKRLADFLIYRFGGPPTYLEERGHPRLRGRHLPFAIGEAERDRWLQLMESAMTEIDLPEEAVPLLRGFFAQVADFMRNLDGLGRGVAESV